MPDFGDYDPTTGRTSARTEFEGTVDPYAPSVANGQITPEQWAEYQKRRKWDFIKGLAGVFGGTVALGGLGGMVGGGAGGAAGSAGAGAGAATLPPAATAGMLPMSVAGPAVGAGAGGAGALGGMFGSMTARDLAALGLTGASVVGGLTNRPGPTAPTSATTDPNMQKLLATMQGRLDQSEPLYKSIMAMANGLLPTQYQNGGAGR